MTAGAQITQSQWFVLGFVLAACLGAVCCTWWANRKGRAR